MNQQQKNAPYLSHTLKVDKQAVATGFKFYPLSFSWVAPHPQPKGVMQFIGGAFFGSFPTVFYRYLLEQLYLDGYTIIALPFRFTFNHWSVASSLLREQQTLRPLLEQLAAQLGYESTVYRQSSRYSWVGHSLGCKYIALLELLAGDPDETFQLIETYGKRPQAQTQAIQQSLQNVSITIRDQPSLLLAPDIGDTADAIKLPFLPALLDHFGWGVLPTKKGTFDFIQHSSLFHLTAMLSFRDDHIAGSETLPPGIDNTVRTLLESLKSKLLHQEIEGAHLRPLGLALGRFVVGPISAPPWQLVPLVFHLLQRLQQRLAKH